MRAILGNPRCTGRQVWNRQRTDAELVNPANTGLRHRPVQRWNLPEGWVISARPAHPAIVTEADFIAAQDRAAGRGPGSPAGRRYLLAGAAALRHLRASPGILLVQRQGLYRSQNSAWTVTCGLATGGMRQDRGSWLSVCST